MKECDILGVKTYSDPSYIFSGGQDLPTPWSTPRRARLKKCIRAEADIWNTCCKL